MLHRLVYRSLYVPEAGGGPLVTIRDILARSHDNNFREHITGFLIFDKITFVQVLEGPRAAVTETYRAFPDWTMGGFLRADDAQHIYDAHGFSAGLDVGTLTAERVIALAQDLEAFDRQAG